MTTHLKRMLALLGLLAGCGLDLSEGSGSKGPLKCEYEQSRTSCSGYGYGPWEQRCLDIEYPKDGLTADGWCDIVVSDSSECASSCCVSYRFRNAVGSKGRCP